MLWVTVLWLLGFEELIAASDLIRYAESVESFLRVYSNKDCSCSCSSFVDTFGVCWVGFFWLNKNNSCSSTCSASWRPKVCRVEIFDFSEKVLTPALQMNWGRVKRGRWECLSCGLYEVSVLVCCGCLCCWFCFGLFGLVLYVDCGWFWVGSWVAVGWGCLVGCAVGNWFSVCGACSYRIHETSAVFEDIVESDVD